METKIIKFLNLWLPPVLWAGLIFKFSSGTVPSASQIYWQDFAVKKIGHFLLFGVLSVLIYRGLIGHGISRKKAAIWAVAIAFLYGAADEYHQIFTQGREARLRDVLIDGIGAGVIIYYIYRFLPKFPKKIQTFLLQFGIN
ncbi:MAG: VanZ family protein [Candidatus Woesebacteria bacterium]|nr:VanZ family protein [Candidatus Woesebacteria bacterium]